MSSGRSPPLGGGGPRTASEPSEAKAKSDVPGATSRLAPVAASTSQSMPPAAAEARAAMCFPSGDQAIERSPSMFTAARARNPSLLGATQARVASAGDQARSLAAGATWTASPPGEATHNSPSPARKRHEARKAISPVFGENANI